jgi:hypothetical protein
MHIAAISNATSPTRFNLIPICTTFLLYLFYFTVWVYSKPGKYYFAIATFYDGCKESLVDGIQKYTLAFFIYTAVLLVTMIMNLKVWSTQKEAEEESNNEALRREHYAVTM